MVRCPLCISVSFLTNITEYIINKQIAEPLKPANEENLVSGVCIDKDSGQKLLEEEPAVWNKRFY
jgi:hypothetical protein